MTGGRRLLAGVAALSALLAIASPPPAVAAEDDDSGQSLTMAVMGDLPYGDTKLANLPTLIDAVNADPTVDLVAHLGDIKAGTNSPCTDGYFQQIHDSFNRFDDPLIYTPGDNEWTDCHVVDTPVAANVTRLVVEGSNTVPTRFEYVRLAVQPRSAQLFSWDRVDVPFA